MHELTPEDERAWSLLRRHLERSQQFTLVFLASAYPPALTEIRGRLEATLQSRTSRLEMVEVEEAAAQWGQRLEAALALDEERVRMRSPVWLSLEGDPEDPAMNLHRDAILASLNQQRTQLERSFRRPLLIALPRSYLPRTWKVAPDLWMIRGIVAEFPARARTRSLPAPSPAPVRIASSEPESLRPVAEWRRVAARAIVEPEAVSPFVAHVAVEAALDNASFAVALQIAEQGLALARVRAAGEVPDRQGNLAIALDDVGNAARELGRLEAAEQAFAESLAVTRRLLEAAPESRTALGDLSVALDNAGNVARDRGQLEVAEQAFAESLAVRRRLLDAVGESPTALRDLTVSLDNVGNVARDREQLEAAEQAFAESLAVSRRLLEAVGERPTTLRDLSVSLKNVGNVARDRGQLEAADQAFAEREAVRQRLQALLAVDPG